MNETYPGEDARTALAAFYAEKRRTPDVVPYIGPQDTLDRFLAGAVITFEDFVTDQSLFTLQAVLPQQMRRLTWMIERSKRQPSRSTAQPQE